MALTGKRDSVREGEGVEGLQSLIGKMLRKKKGKGTHRKGAGCGTVTQISCFAIIQTGLWSQATTHY